MKASCICVLWPSTKLRSVKMLKKKQTQNSKTKKQQWQNKQTKPQGQYPAILMEETR